MTQQKEAFEFYFSREAFVLLIIALESPEKLARIPKVEQRVYRGNPHPDLR
jgi:hypothetical protein